MAIVGAPASRAWSEILDSAERGVYEVTTTGRRAGRFAAADRRDAQGMAVGRSVRPDPERRHGLDARPRLRAIRT